MAMKAENPIVRKGGNTDFVIVHPATLISSEQAHAIADVPSVEKAYVAFP